MESVLSFSIASGFNKSNDELISSRPVAHNLRNGNKTVNRILRELEKVKASRPSKLLQNIESLIYSVVHLLRKIGVNDHLLQTTAIWALINVYRLEPSISKDVMLVTGVPGVLFEIMKSERLAGSTRQYASELCYYLSSNQSFPSIKRQRTGAFTIDKLDIPPGISKTTQRDDVSDVSSFIDDTKQSNAFEPYRINDENIKSLQSLFHRDKVSDFDVLSSNVAVLGYTEDLGSDSISTIDSSLSSRFNKHPITGTSKAMNAMAKNSRTLFTEVSYSKCQKSQSIPQLFDLKMSGKHKNMNTSTSSSIISNANRSTSNDSTNIDDSPLFSTTLPLISSVRTSYAASLNLNYASNLQQHSTNSGIADIPDTFAKLDPLSLNVTAGYHSAFADEEDDLFSNADGSDDDDSGDDSVDDDAGMGYNTTQTIRRNRIRAEKLVDLEFTKRLFNNKATLADAQSFISRMESLFEVIDDKKSGYVTWEAFAQVVLSLAPTKLLRADVSAFMDAQCSNAKDLIDYREFVISGKVIIIQKKVENSVLPINGWLERQRLYVGDASTYTWVNHSKWYHKRLAVSVVWLMRRASRALGLYWKLEIAKKFLLLAGKRAIAVNYCLEVAWLAAEAEKKRIEAKRRLMRKSFHARVWGTKVEEAARFLLFSAIGVKTYQKQHEDIIVTELPAKKKQADYATLFRLHLNYTRSQAYLKHQAHMAVKHIMRKEDAVGWLMGYAGSVMTQIMIRVRAQEWLEERGIKAYEHCIITDETWAYLLNRGGRAYRYMVRQEEALEGTLHVGRKAVEFITRKAVIRDALATYAQNKLLFLNTREHSFVYLQHRKTMAVALIARRSEAMDYLLRIAPVYWKKVDFVESCRMWLLDRSIRAMVHSDYQHKCYNRLQFIATRARVIKRKHNLTKTELQQYGQFSKFTHFRNNWLPQPGNDTKHDLEVARLVAYDKKVAKSRASMSLEDKWRVELEDAFKLIADNFQLQGGTNLHNVISRLGFRRLLLEGKLLDILPETLDSHWGSIDSDSSGYVMFKELWYWFINEANRKNRSMHLQHNRSIVFSFVLNDIWSLSDRALFVLAQKYDLICGKSSSDDAEALSYSRATVVDDSSDEEDAAESSDDEENDIKVFLKIQRKYYEREALSIDVDDAAATATDACVDDE